MLNHKRCAIKGAEGELPVSDQSNDPTNTNTTTLYQCHNEPGTRMDVSLVNPFFSFLEFHSNIYREHSIVRLSDSPPVPHLTAGGNLHEEVCFKNWFNK